MEPDVVEIAPFTVPSGSRTRKPRKTGIPEVIDVEQYEFRNGGFLNNNNNGVVDTKNKGKAIQESSFSFNNIGSSQMNNLFGVLANDVVDVDAYISSRSSSFSNQANPLMAAQYFPESGLLQNNQATYSPAAYSAFMVHPQNPDILMMPTPPSDPLKYDASASSSRFTGEEFVALAQKPPSARRIKQRFLRDFKRFDTVEDFSGHHYASSGKASKQHSKTWVKKVQGDWKILENDLPETIFVRACESRMDLLRAVIIGPEGTPYHDGLFFFDIQFPDTYPSVPPKVHYHSGGLRINPNLYNCGKVCLSLLGTWSGSAREKWLPKESTMLQLLVSIQALILNQKPYFNEPGYESTMGTASGETHSKAYSENVFILSLKTMVYSMRNPPKHFEEFVRSHFFVRAKDIVKACEAYRDGAPVASIVRGGVQDVEETSLSGSKKFRTDVVTYMKPVVEEFAKLGVKELEEKLKPPESSNANADSRKRGRSSSIKEFLANIGRCVFQQ